MSLWEDLISADKKKLFKSDDNFTMHSTGYMALDYANGFWQEVKMGDKTIQVPAVGLMGGTFTTVIGTTGSGKSIPVDTMIPTPKGMCRVGDIKDFDAVFNKNGKPVTVLGTYPQGVKELYTVTFEDGRTAKCSPDHLWTLVDPMGCSKTMSLKEIMEYDNMIKEYDFAVPICGPVKYHNWKVPIIPYALGVCLTTAIPNNKVLTLRIHDSQMNILYRTAELLDVIYNRIDDPAHDFLGYHLYQFSDSFSGEDVLTKDIFDDNEIFDRIPNIYLTSNIQIRMNLLAGILDVLGEPSKKNQIKLSLHSQKLANDIRQLVWSLGMHCYQYVLNDNEIILDIGCSDDMRVCLFGVDRAVMMKEFEEGDNERRHAGYDRLHITNIEFTGRAEQVCLYVDDPDHCFLTENYVVTHNTTLADQIGWNIVKDFADGLLIHCDAEKTSTRQRITQICGCDYNEPRIRLAKSHCSIESVLTMFNTICDMKEAGGKQYQYEYKGPTYDGKPFMAYVPTVFIIDSLPAFNSEDYNTKDLGNNVDQMRAAKDVTRFYTDCINRAWEYNIMFIVINHIRPKADMNPYQQPPKGLMMLGPAETLPRGQVAQYYSQTFFRINTKKSNKYTPSDNGISGYQTMVQMAKTKTNTVGTSFPVAFGNALGFDPVYSLYEFASEIGLIEGTRNKRIHGLDEFPFLKKDFRKTFLESPTFAEAVIKTLQPYFETLLGPKPNTEELLSEAEAGDGPDFSKLDELAGDE